MQVRPAHSPEPGLCTSAPVLHARQGQAVPAGRTGAAASSPGRACRLCAGAGGQVGSLHASGLPGADQWLQPLPCWTCPGRHPPLELSLYCAAQGRWGRCRTWSGVSCRAASPSTASWARRTASAPRAPPWWWTPSGSRASPLSWTPCRCLLSQLAWHRAGSMSGAPACLPACKVSRPLTQPAQLSWGWTSLGFSSLHVHIQTQREQGSQPPGACSGS